MAGRIEGEFQSIHDRLDRLSFEWRGIPVLPDAIRKYQDIVEHPTSYFYEVEDMSGTVERGNLESPFDLDSVTFLYGLSDLQSVEQREQSEDFFSVTFGLAPLRNVMALEPLSDVTPFLCIERTPQTIDGMLDQVERGVNIAALLTEGIPELRDVTENFFVGVTRGAYRYPVSPLHTLTGTQLSLVPVYGAIKREDEDSRKAIQHMASRISTLSPDSLDRIKICDITLREGVLFKKIISN